MEDKVARMMRPPANQRPAVDQLTNQKQRLPPLIELIEPTPPLCRSAPIFGLTGLDDAEFDLNSVSDDLNPFGPEDPRRESAKRNENIGIKYFYSDAISTSWMVMSSFDRGIFKLEICKCMRIKDINKRRENF